MYKFTVDELVEATNGKLILNNNIIVDDISIDSREVKNTSLFIPIIGEVYDGHKFLNNAYDLGCRCFLIDENHSFDKEDITLIKVKNTTIAFGSISKYFRNRFNIPVVGITGSVGKTTTKDMTYSVLSMKYNTLKNYENFNNEIGVPKTLLGLDSDNEVAVVEMGMQHKGELDYLTNLVKPKIAVISTIGMAHIEFFDDQKGIFDAKMEIVNGFDGDNNVLIVNGDNEFLKTLRDVNHSYQLFTYGFESYNNLCCVSYIINESSSSFVCRYNNNLYDFEIPNPAKHNILNAMAAIMVGLVMHIDISLIQKGLKCYESSKNRMDIFKINNYTIINDSYNASVDSMIGMIDVLSNYKNRKVAILGDMFELGDSSISSHKKIGKYVKDKNIDILITVGNDSKYMNSCALENGFNENNLYHFNNLDELKNNIYSILNDEDIVLIKASNGMKLFEMVDYLKNN